MPTLLEKALSNNFFKGNVTYSNEELELIRAWAEDKITISQVTNALDQKKGRNIYSFLARGMKVLWRVQYTNDRMAKENQR